MTMIHFNMPVFRDQQAKVVQEKLVNLLQMGFFGAILVTAAFLSCLTAMRLAIRGSEVTVPSLLGQTVPQADNLVLNSQLKLRVGGHRFDDAVLPDQIISQSPSPNSQLKRHGTVKVFVSLGSRRILVPDLTGKTLRASHYLLLQRGLNPGLTSMISSEQDKLGTILSQYPLPKHEKARSPNVNLLVSTGRSKGSYLMPSLVGQRLKPVSRTLERLGIGLRTVSYQSLPGLAKGTILSHVPGAGDKLIEGEDVEIEVAQ